MPEDLTAGVMLDETWIERCWGEGGVPDIAEGDASGEADSDE